MRILCVDDKEANRYLLETLLRGSGYEVVSATHGVEALEKLRDGPFDLIVSDILMPRMDGFQFCREVKKQPALASIPFVFYTATYTERKDEELGLSLGAVRFIIKPQEPERFLEIIGEVIGEQADSAQSPAASPPPDDDDFLIAYNQRLIHKLEAKIQQLETVSQSLRLALNDKEREMGERRRAEAETERRNRELALLNRVLEAASSGLTPDRLLELVSRELAHAFTLPHVLATLWNEEGTALAAAAESALPGLSAPIVPALIQIGGTPAQALLESQEPKLVENPRGDARVTALTAWMRCSDPVTWLIVPLVTEGKVLGHLFLSGSEPQAFSPEVTTLAFTVAGQAAKELAFARLHETQRRLTAALEQIPESVLVTDLRGSILYANPTFERTTGYTLAECRGRTPRFLKSGQHDDAFYSELWTRIAAGEIWRGRFVNRKRDGAVFTEDAVIAPIRDERGLVVSYLAVKRDITHDLILEEQYRQAQKMEAVGQMAGGVAHDFNNILTAVLMQLGFLLETPGLTVELRSGLEEIQESSQRAASLTRQLLLFSRQQVMQAKSVELNAILGGVVKMLRRVLGEHIQLRWEPCADPLWLHADPGMLEQVVMNLCLNARDAMPKGGPIAIEASACRVRANTPEGERSAEGDRFVRLSVAGRRLRDRRDHPPAAVRALLHYQGNRPRHRPGLGDRETHRRAASRVDRG